MTGALFIMTDRQFADAMSCRMGTQYIRTPAMDSLAGAKVDTNDFVCMGTRREALFDMQADPLETANLAGDPAHKQTVLDHRKILADFAARHGDETARAARQAASES